MNKATAKTASNKSISAEPNNMISPQVSVPQHPEPVKSDESLIK